LGAEIGAHLGGLVVVQRARVRFLVGDAQAGQTVDNRLTLYFQLTRQFVDSNCTHSLLLRLPRFRNKAEVRKQKVE
jgi:hypothetical protein